MRVFLKTILISTVLLLGCANPIGEEAVDTAEILSSEYIPMSPKVGTTPIPTGTTETHIYRPEGDGPFPAVYFLQGYPCRTINPDHDKSLARARLIARYVEAGFLVYLAEKPGMGELSGTASTTKPCEDMTYPEEVAAFSASFAGLENHPDVKRDEIFLFGHSMGGQTAPLIAQDYDVAGIITYGIHAKPWFEFMIDISRDQGERLGIDPVKLQGETAMMIPFLYDLMIAKEDWDVLSTRHAEAIKGGVMPADGRRINGRDYTFWATLNDADFVSAWGSYKGQVLAMYGEYDIASITPEGAERIADIVNFHNPGNARSLVLPKADHGFVYFDGNFDAYKAKRFSKDWTGTYAAKNFDQRIAEETIAWIEEVRAKNSKGKDSAQ